VFVINTPFSSINILCVSIRISILLSIILSGSLSLKYEIISLYFNELLCSRIYSHTVSVYLIDNSLTKSRNLLCARLHAAHVSLISSYSSLYCFMSCSKSSILSFLLKFIRYFVGIVLIYIQIAYKNIISVYRTTHISITLGSLRLVA